MNDAILLSIKDFLLSGEVETDNPEKETMAINISDLQINAGEVIAVIGGSGCGKSVLLSLLMGYPSFGTGERNTHKAYRIFGCDMPYDAFVNIKNAFRWRKTVLGKGNLFYLPQQFPVSKTLAIKTRDAVNTVVLAYIGNNPINRVKARRLIYKKFKDFELYGTLKKPINALSGGERRRVELLARLVAMEILKKTGLLILDEPTTGFDPENADKFILEIRKGIDYLIEKGVPVAALLSTHQLKSLEKVKDDDRKVIDKVVLVHRDNGNEINGVAAAPSVCNVICTTDAGTLAKSIVAEEDFSFAFYGEKIYAILKTKPAASWINIFKEI